MGHDVHATPPDWPALDDLVTRVSETRRGIAVLEAQQAALLAEATELVRARSDERRVARRREARDIALREVAAELGAALRVSDRVVQARMSDAFALTESFPATMRTLLGGDVDAAHARVIVDAGAAIVDPAVRAEYERILLEAARFETPPRLRAIAQVVAVRLDPEMLADMHRRARSERQVRLTDRGDGLSRLLVDIPTALGHAIIDRLTQMAHEIDDSESNNEVDDPGDDRGAHARNPGNAQGGASHHDVPSTTTGPSIGRDDLTAPAARPRSSAPHVRARTMDQKRVDILADLLLTGAPTAHGDGALGAIRAHVQVTVPVLTLAGVDDEPALLAGSGPIDVETARALAAGAPGWDRVMFHPHSGAPLAVDRYRPSKQLRRFLRVRDERCRFPGCTQKTWRCDADHTVDHAFGGRTEAQNLAHVCRRHHTVKHATAWRVRQLGGGVLEWRAPTGRKYPDSPPATVQFVPSAWLERARGLARIGRESSDGDADPPPPF